MILVDEGKVKLDDPVEKYLPEFKDVMVASEPEKGEGRLHKPKHPITVRELLRHTSGLPFKSAQGTPRRSTLPLRDAVSELRDDAAACTSRAASTSTRTRASTPPAESSKSSAACRTKSSWTSGCSQPLGMKDTTFWPSEDAGQAAGESVQARTRPRPGWRRRRSRSSGIR